jgi:hypothetical protein
LARLEAALAQVPEVTATKARRGDKDAPVRVSTTDPDARVMKMRVSAHRDHSDRSIVITRIGPS